MHAALIIGGAVLIGLGIGLLLGWLTEGGVVEPKWSE